MSLVDLHHGVSATFFFVELEIHNCNCSKMLKIHGLMCFAFFFFLMRFFNGLSYMEKAQRGSK